MNYVYFTCKIDNRMSGMGYVCVDKNVYVVQINCTFYTYKS